MMIVSALAITFITPLLLVGLIAAAIPPMLHLLAVVRAREVYFPTVRFLKISMEKSARRRRIENLLLMILRSILLAALAVAVAEPIVHAAGILWSGKHSAAAIIIDNSYSMGLKQTNATQLDQIRREAIELLSGSDRPSAAAVIPTDTLEQSTTLESDLEIPRRRIMQIKLGWRKAAIIPAVKKAISLLREYTAGGKTIYLFSDLQKINFANLTDLADLAAANSDISWMIIHPHPNQPSNVGLSKLTLTGPAIVNRPLDIAATVINSSTSDKVVHIGLEVDGKPVGQNIRVVLKSAGTKGAKTTVHFPHRFSNPGIHTGKVFIIEKDDLMLDQVRYFSVEIAGPIEALIVRSRLEKNPWQDPAAMLRLALESARGWSIRCRTITTSAFTPDTLKTARVIFLADIPNFSTKQARAIRQFVQSGKIAVFFLGADINVDNYNRELADLLPGKIVGAIGQVGPDAPAVKTELNINHPYLAGLYPTAADYPAVIVQRYFRLMDISAPYETIISTPTGDPIALVKDCGKGKVVLFTTTADTEWTNLPATTIFLPILTRICLQAGEIAVMNHTYLANQRVKIPLPAEFAKLPRLAINITKPDGTIIPLIVKPAATNAPADITFTQTDKPGIYRWQTIINKGNTPVELQGAFAINPEGDECDLTRISPSQLADAFRLAAQQAGKSAPAIYFGKSLDEVRSVAAAASAGVNIWDRFLAAVIVLLVLESLIANRFKKPSPQAIG